MGNWLSYNNIWESEYMYVYVLKIDLINIKDTTQLCINIYLSSTAVISPHQPKEDCSYIVELTQSKEPENINRHEWMQSGLSRSLES